MHAMWYELARLIEALPLGELLVKWPGRHCCQCGIHDAYHYIMHVHELAGTTGSVVSVAAISLDRPPAVRKGQISRCP